MDFKYESIISGKIDNYQIKKILGSGLSGIVTQCLKLGTGEMVAVKIFKSSQTYMARREVDMYEKLKKLVQNKNNWVRLIEDFMFKNHAFLVFELLDKDLSHLIEGPTEPAPLKLSEIRVIAQQLLVTLKDFKNAEMVHTDIKPENIMLVNHELLPFKVKLIDFACVLRNYEMRLGIEIQPICYRAPEVILGLPLNEAVDMWSLGCLLAFLYLGEDLYPCQSVREVMRVIVQIQGIPEDHMLHNGLYAKRYFNYRSSHCQWRLKGKPCKRKTGISDQFKNLDDLARKNVKDVTEYEDTQAFLSLLKLILQVDPAKRIKPSEALKHSFITMEHLPSNDNEYVKSARLAIKKSQQEQSLVAETKNVPPVTAGLDNAISTRRNKKLHGTYIIEVKPQKTMSIKVQSWDEASCTSNDTLSADEGTAESTSNGPPTTFSFNDSVAAIPSYRAAARADRTTAGNNDGSPATAVSNDASAAGTDKKRPGRCDVRSPASFNSSSDKSFIEVKTRKKWFKKLEKFRELKVIRGNDRLSAAKDTSKSTNNESPAPFSLDDSIAASNAESLATIDLNSDGANTNSDERNISVVEVKTRQKHFKRIHGFFSGMSESICCCKADVIE